MGDFMFGLEVLIVYLSPTLGNDWLLQIPNLTGSIFLQMSWLGPKIEIFCFAKMSSFTISRTNSVHVSINLGSVSDLHSFSADPDPAENLDAD
jgi:hypothetical protein